ncbi:MAG: hypothetical protein J3Q66DRAFT_330474 [Benniella sp.]|nr:MAG: hypothetical protein J3Q66DRAFT_330474 [Benniella sp.]
MFNIPFQSVSDVPELLLLIAEYLDPCDILNCMLTCKALARDLEPCIWRHISMKRKAPSEDAMSRNLHLIRTLCLQYNDLWIQHLYVLAHGSPSCVAPGGSSSEAPIQFAHLRAITLLLPRKGYRDFAALDYITTIFRGNQKTITSLTFPTYILNQKRFHPLIQASLLAKLPNLRDLTIRDAGGHVDIDKVVELLKGCLLHPRLISLQCIFTIPDQNQLVSPLENMFSFLTNATTSDNNPGATQIKDIRLPWSKRGYNESALLPFLMTYGSSLETICIPASSIVLNNKIVEMFEKLCPKLRHISAIWAQNNGQENRAVIATHRSGRKKADLDPVDPGLDTTDPNHTARVLIQQHTEALREMHISYGNHPVKGNHLLLERCTRLKKISVEIHVQPGYKDWTCYGLTELKLTYMKPTKESSPSTSRALYNQIGRLVHLEYLAIGYGGKKGGQYALDLSLADGWLARLKDLKRLRHFQMNSGLWRGIGMSEVKYMHDNWRMLQRVTFKCKENRLDNLKKSPSWTWICTKRPWLQLSRVCDE